MEAFKLKQKSGLTKGVLYLMAITSCLVVANNYYNQPLLGDISREFAVSESMANKVATATIFGYAVGLFLLVPLGDSFRKKKLIIYDFAVIIASLLLFAFATNIYILLIAGFMIGLSSVVPQMLVPLTAQLSVPEERSKNIGIVMTGLLIGILGSRVVSGLLGEYMGWRNVFLLAAGMMFVIWILNALLLPDVNPTFKGTYRALMRSVLTLARKRVDLQKAVVRGGLSLASFQIFWTTLVFHLERPPFSAGSDVAGLLGIVGIGGALAAGYVGRIADRVNKKNLLVASTLLMIMGWICFGVWGLSYIGLIIGIFIFDVGLQAIHITNQSIIFAKDVDATNRVNTVYMTGYFLGGTVGAYVAGHAWNLYGWNGVVSVGLLTVLILLGFLFSRL